MQLPCCELQHGGGQSGTAEPVGTDLCNVAGCGRYCSSQQQCVLLGHKGQKSPLQQRSKMVMIMCKAQCQAWASPLSCWHRCLYQKRAALLCTGFCISKRCTMQDKWPQVTSLLCLPALKRPQTQEADRASQHKGSVNQKQGTEPRLPCTE